MRGVNWTDAAADIGATIERGGVPRFVVFGVDGKMAGAFDTLGVVDVGVGVEKAVASGTYTGASPCTYETGAKPANSQCRSGLQLGMASRTSSSSQ